MNPAAAAMAARLFAVDPVGLGGVLLQSGAGAARDEWLRVARELMGADSPWRRLPAHIDDDRLLGGLDLAATLATGHVVARRGVLAEADGGVVVLSMAERVAPGTAARIAAVQEAGAVGAQGDGGRRADPARWGLVALDESEAGDEGVPPVLGERLALHVRLVLETGWRPADGDRASDHGAIAMARTVLPNVRANDAIVGALCEAARTLGVESLRAAFLALRVASAAAALRGSDVVEAEDAAWAASLVLGPRARRWPAGQDPGESEHAAEDAQPAAAEPADSDDAAEPSPPPPTAAASGAADAAADEVRAKPMEDALVEAAGASLPPALLAAVAASMASAALSHGGAQLARSGRARESLAHGRPLGARRGELRGGARLDLLQTFTAAAPWQPLRRRERSTRADAAPAILVRRGDFHVRRFRMREQSTTIFAVDASGSQALHRLAEAKGAAELLLADCYVRRDRVAVLAFRGDSASVLLPPTRSLVRAKRCLAGLPGGGATPLAAGLDAARQLAQGIVQQGGTPLLVLLTDGKANMTRAGQPGRIAAQAEAMSAARAWRATGLGALLLDTAPEPQPRARELAGAMQARYVALPHADSRALARAIGEHRAPSV